MVRVLTAFQTDEVLYVLIWSTLTFHGLLSLFLSRLHTHARTHTHTRAHIIALSPLLRMSAAIHRQFSAQRACWCIRLSHTPEFVAKVKERREKNSTRMHSQKSNLHTHTHTHIHTYMYTHTHIHTSSLYPSSKKQKKKKDGMQRYRESKPRSNVQCRLSVVIPAVAVCTCRNPRRDLGQFLL